MTTNETTAAEPKYIPLDFNSISIMTQFFSDSVLHVKISHSPSDWNARKLSARHAGELAHFSPSSTVYVKTD